MNPVVRTVVLLTLSDVFMTCAWYARLEHFNQRPWIGAALMRQPSRLHYLWTALCILAAVYFVFGKSA